MNKVIVFCLVLVSSYAIYVSYLWVDIVITRDYELQTLSSLKESSDTSKLLLEKEWKGKNIDEIINLLSAHSNSSQDIINKLLEGDGELWFKTIKFTFKDNLLISVG